MSSGIKGFVSEKQLEEKRKARQEEWEKVRKPEDPVQAPEEQYDPRSLYERLKEQQDKKQEEFEEQLKFKNQFRGINQEESDFLLDVGKKTLEMEKQKREEEKKELDDFRTALAQSRELPEVDLELPKEREDKQPQKKFEIVKKNQQLNILKNAVKRKASPSDPGKASEEKNSLADKGAAKVKKLEDVKATIVLPSATKCVGILPGLAAYDDEGSDDSDESSSDGSEEVSNNLLSSIVHNQNDCT